jgi:uncharacterized membrane protein YfcA
MIYVVIAITALSASFLTFFSGFGLGTILMPVFALFFDLKTAIALTAIVHLLNNLFKLGLVYRSINFQVVLKFGLPALIASFIGAWLLNQLDQSGLIIFTYYLGLSELHITWPGLIIGSIILFFSMVELIEKLNTLSFNKNLLIPGGILTGFFGGLSGHQGALRSAFLLRLNLEKTAFIATGVAIACLVDVARLSTYSYQLSVITQNYAILGLAIASSFSGALIGNKLFRKTSIAFLKWIVGIFMLIVSVLIIGGVISK